VTMGGPSRVEHVHGGSDPVNKHVADNKQKCKEANRARKAAHRKGNNQKQHMKRPQFRKAAQVKAGGGGVHRNWQQRHHHCYNTPGRQLSPSAPSRTRVIGRPAGRPLARGEPRYCCAEGMAASRSARDVALPTHT